MTKEQFLKKWVVGDKMPPDLDAVIAHEIAKVQEKPQPELNPIEQAYHNGIKIKSKNGNWALWYQKINENHFIDSKNRKIDSEFLLDELKRHPEKWELYTEPAEKPSSQVKLDNSFDKDRFEAMFRAVVASGRTERWEQDFKFTEEALAKLDAYYADKEKGGNNE